MSVCVQHHIPNECHWKMHVPSSVRFCTVLAVLYIHTSAVYMCNLCIYPNHRLAHVAFDTQLARFGSLGVCLILGDFAISS